MSKFNQKLEEISKVYLKEQVSPNYELRAKLINDIESKTGIVSDAWSKFLDKDLQTLLNLISNPTTKI